MVEDDPADAATRALVARPRRALRGARGAARAQRRAQRGDRGGRGRAALLPRRRRRAPGPAGSPRCSPPPRRTPGHEAFGGPIRAGARGHRTCTPAGASRCRSRRSTSGPDDRDAELVWGANLAVRRAARRARRPVRPARSGPGDEEEWERRLRAAGGRIRYVAAAGVDHRRSGADARIRGLSRAAWHRGRHGRRFDEAKGVAPSLARRAAHARRLRLAHRPPPLRQRHRPRRRRPRAGSREALAPRGRTGRRGRRAASTGPTSPGRAGTLGRRGLLAGRARDLVADARDRGAAPGAAARRARDAAAAARARGRRRRGPSSARCADAIAAELARSRHDVALHLAAGAPGLGKWENLRAAAAAAAAARLAAAWSTTTSCSRAASSTSSSTWPRRTACSSPSPRTRRLPRRLAGHAPAAGPRRAAHALRRDRPGDRASTPTPSPRCCRSRPCAWAGGWTRTGRRAAAERRAARSASSTPRRCATCARSRPPTRTRPRSPRPTRSSPDAAVRHARRGGRGAARRGA